LVGCWLAEARQFDCIVGDLDPHDHVRMVGDLKCAGDRVVVGQGDQVHPASLARGVRVGRVDEGLGHQGARQEPAAGIGRGTRVQMEIDAGGDRVGAGHATAAQGE